jgi:hypothetical protein
MTVLKRDRSESKTDLVAALEDLIPLLEDEGEEAAAADLKTAAAALRAAAAGSAEEKKSIEQVIDAFEGDHELMAYTHKREGNVSQWTIAEQLFNASTRVISLARRFKR